MTNEKGGCGVEEIYRRKEEGPVPSVKKSTGEQDSEEWRVIKGAIENGCIEQG